METVAVEGVEVVIETEVAFLCVVRGKEVWVPREHVVNPEMWRAGERGTLVVPRWLAVRKGLL